MRRQLINRKGSYMAEAAVVLPFVILSVITVVLILMHFYQQSVSQSDMHMALRAEAGRITGQSPESRNSGITSRDSRWNGNVSVGREGVFRNVSGTCRTGMIAGGLIRSSGKAVFSGTWHAADGVEFKRGLSLKGVIPDE